MDINRTLLTKWDNEVDLRVDFTNASSYYSCDYRQSRRWTKKSSCPNTPYENQSINQSSDQPVFGVLMGLFLL